MDNMAIFAQRLKAQREKLGLTQAQLAEKIGVTSQTISAYEKNSSGEKGKTPTLDKAVALAQALNISLDYLCGHDSCQAECEIETLADIIDCISKIANKVDCYAGTRKVPLPPEACYEAVINEEGDTDIVSTEMAAVLTINDSTLAWHFKNRNKVTALYNDGVIDRTLYDTIIEGELAKLRQHTIISRPSYKTRRPPISIDPGDGKVLN